MSELAINSAQVWVKLQKRLGNNMSYYLSPAERTLLDDAIATQGTIGEQVGVVEAGPAAEVEIDASGPYEWAGGTTATLTMAVPAEVVTYDIQAGDQTPDVLLAICNLLEEAQPSLLIQTNGATNVITSAAVISNKAGTNLTVASFEVA